MYKTMQTNNANINTQLTTLLNTANNKQTAKRVIETFCDSGIITDLLMNIEYNTLEGLIGDEMHELGINELNDILVQHGHEAIEAVVLLGELHKLMAQHEMDDIEDICGMIMDVIGGYNNNNVIPNPN